jgi:hypothetical protein
MEVRKKKIFYSEDEALDCQAQHEGAEMDFRVGHGTMLNGKWTYEIPENRPSWTVSWTVPVSVAVEVSGGLVQAVYARGGDVGADVFDLDAPDFPGEGEQEEAESRKKQLDELIGSPGWKRVW